MRSLIAAVCLSLLVLPAAAERVATDSHDYDAARWADWEAQARMADGDYEGAVQAEQEAQVNWAKLDHAPMNHAQLDPPPLDRTKADRNRQAGSPARMPR